jgi:hypothetical protein
MPWYEPVEEPASSLRDRAIYVAIAAAAGVVFGIVGGWLWSVVADPPTGVLTDRGVFLTDELSYNQQVLMTLWFLIVGAGLGLVAGALFGLRGRRHGVTVVVAVLVLTAIAAGVSAWLGIHVFGPDPDSQIAHSAVGDPITSALEIETFVAYLGWPIGGLLGVLATVSTWRQSESTHSPWPSTNVSPH